MGSQEQLPFLQFAGVLEPKFLFEVAQEVLEEERVCPSFC